MNNKEAIFLAYLLNICRTFEFCICQGSVATCIKFRWVMCGFCSKFHALSSSAKMENLLWFDKVI